MSRKRMVLAVLGLCVWFVYSGSTGKAGDLNPPAAPGSTMKTLDEVEPRIPIHQSDIPLIITASGSYYLAENVSLAAGSGRCIEVQIDDVTIDLCGFVMSGADSNSSYGVYMNGRSNVEIRNGTIRDFYTGIIESDSTNGKNHRVYGVRVLSCVYSSIYMRYCENCRVMDCTIADGGTRTGVSGTVYAICVGAGSTVAGNSIYNYGISTSCRSYGIETGSNCAVTGNTVHDTGTSSTADYAVGIWTGYNCTVAGNSVYDNGDSTSSATVYGIHAGIASVVTDNSVYSNGDSAGGTVYGFACDHSCTVARNTSHENGISASATVYGISVGDGSTVVHNTAYGNGDSSTGSSVRGIYASTGCTVTANTSRNNGLGATGTVYGIYLAGYSTVFNNTAYGNNGTNMYLGTGCVYGYNCAP